MSKQNWAQKKKNMANPKKNNNFDETFNKS